MMIYDDDVTMSARKSCLLALLSRLPSETAAPIIYHDAHCIFRFASLMSGHISLPHERIFAPPHADEVRCFSASLMPLHYYAPKARTGMLITPRFITHDAESNTTMPPMLLDRQNAACRDEGADLSAFRRLGQTALPSPQSAAHYRRVIARHFRLKFPTRRAL